MLSIFFVDLYKYACAHVCGRLAYTCCSYRLQFVLYCMYRFASIAFSVDFGLISLRVCSCVCVRSKKFMCIRACGKVFYHRRKKKKEVLPVNANGLSQTHRSARPGTCLDKLAANSAQATPKFERLAPDASFQKPRHSPMLPTRRGSLVTRRTHWTQCPGPGQQGRRRRFRNFRCRA